MLEKQAIKDIYIVFLKYQRTILKDYTLDYMGASGLTTIYFYKV